MNIIIFATLSLLYVISRCDDNVKTKEIDNISKNIPDLSKENKDNNKENKIIKEENKTSEKSKKTTKKEKKKITPEEKKKIKLEEKRRKLEEKKRKLEEKKKKSEEKKNLAEEKRKKNERTKEMVSDIKKHNKEVKEEQNKLKASEKTPSINKKILKLIKDKGALISDFYKTQKEVKEGQKIDQTNNIQAFEENDLLILNKLIESKDITEPFETFLKTANSKIIKQPTLKYSNVIRYIDFFQLDFFNPFLFLKNINKRNEYYYELNLKLFNIFWKFGLTTGIDLGMSFINKNGSKNNTLFVNLALGYNYCKNGHFEVIIGGSMVEYEEIKYWPLWFAVTPINISTDIYRIKNSPITINLNIKLLFKGIITEDMLDFSRGFRTIDKNKIIPYLGDMSNPSIFDTFVDLKIFLGFRYSNDK